MSARAGRPNRDVDGAGPPFAHGDPLDVLGRFVDADGTPRPVSTISSAGGRAPPSVGCFDRVRAPPHAPRAAPEIPTAERFILSCAVFRFMNQNVGATDKRVRTAVGAVAGVASIATLAGAAPLPAVAAPILGVVAIAMLATAATGTCGLYALLGVDTCPADAGGSR